MSTIEQALKNFPLCCGTMLASSKSAYASANAKDVVVFNANICTKQHGKIWYGDLNVTKSHRHLVNLANDLGVDVYVLREMDARFQFENNPQFDKAVCIFLAPVF